MFTCRGRIICFDLSSNEAEDAWEMASSAGAGTNATTR